MPTRRAQARRVPPSPPSDPPSPTPSSSRGEPSQSAAQSVEVDGLRYEIRGPLRRNGRTIVAVRLARTDHGPALVDKADLYSVKSRRSLAQTIADSFGRDVGQIMGALALLLDTAERGAASEPPPPDVLTPERRRAAEELLSRPDLLDRAASVMSQLGYVGEDPTKRIAFLVACSRLLARPISAILVAPSGCGKSELLEVVARLLPDESVEYLSRLTPAALYHVGPDSLRHKLIIIDEQAGATEADYPIRSLQSRGVLRLVAPSNGKPAAPITVRGPIALLSGTTSTTLNPENLSRCLELGLDDSAEQTAKVQVAQALTWSGRPQATPDTRVWQDAQRLLAEHAPIAVIIPFATRLHFPARSTADRRGSARLLGLIASHALLHAHQRKMDKQARVVAMPVDYRAIHTLLRPSMEHAADGLSPRAARAWRELLIARAPASRRDLAARLGVAYNTAKSITKELVEQELLAVVDRGPPARYRVVDRRALGLGIDLLDPDELE